MAVKTAERVAGGRFVPLKELGRAKDGNFAKRPDDGTLALFRVVDWEDEDYPPAKNDKGWDMPLVADVLVIHQDEDGNAERHEVYLRQRIRFAPVYVLRGHPKPDKDVKLRDLPKPNHDEYAKGEVVEIICRIQTKKGGEDGWTALQTPSKAEERLALKVREELGGDDWGSDGDEPF